SGGHRVCSRFFQRPETCGSHLPWTPVADRCRGDAGQDAYIIRVHPQRSGKQRSPMGGRGSRRGPGIGDFPKPKGSPGLQQEPGKRIQGRKTRWRKSLETSEKSRSRLVGIFLIHRIAKSTISLSYCYTSGSIRSTQPSTLNDDTIASWLNVGFKMLRDLPKALSKVTSTL